MVKLSRRSVFSNFKIFSDPRFAFGPLGDQGKRRNESALRRDTYSRSMSKKHLPNFSTNRGLRVKNSGLSAPVEGTGWKNSACWILDDLAIVAAQYRHTRDAETRRVFRSRFTRTNSSNSGIERILPAKFASSIATLDSSISKEQWKVEICRRWKR